jgi:hypothetical protein
MTAGLSQKWHSSRLGMPLFDREIHPVAVALILLIDDEVISMVGILRCCWIGFVGSSISVLKCLCDRIRLHALGLVNLKIFLRP